MSNAECQKFKYFLCTCSSEQRRQVLQWNREQPTIITPTKQILQQASDDSQDQEDIVTYLTEEVKSAGMPVSSQFRLSPTTSPTRSPSRISSRRERPLVLTILRDMR